MLLRHRSSPSRALFIRRATCHPIRQRTLQVGSLVMASSALPSSSPHLSHRRDLSSKQSPESSHSHSTGVDQHSHSIFHSHSHSDHGDESRQMVTILKNKGNRESHEQSATSSLTASCYRQSWEPSDLVGACSQRWTHLW